MLTNKKKIKKYRDFYKFDARAEYVNRFLYRFSSYYNSQLFRTKVFSKKKNSIFLDPP